MIPKRSNKIIKEISKGCKLIYSNRNNEVNKIVFKACVWSMLDRLNANEYNRYIHSTINYLKRV